ncbi:MAG: hypothetical protein GF387_00455 [Candidatus Portnoybacteria bacterium]|nr:hypothetical protein [Candidatus Portnoybacteria bacterium]
MKTHKRYKFLRTGLKSHYGIKKWKKNHWYKYNGDLKIYKTGFHCSKKIYQAFSWVQGEILAEVEVRGKSIKEDDKETWSEMRIVNTWKWQKKDSVALAIYAAELVLENFEKEYPKDKSPRQAIEAAKKVLKNNNAKNRFAAESATWFASRSAVINKISKWMDNHLKALDKIN